MPFLETLQDIWLRTASWASTPYNDGTNRSTSIGSEQLEAIDSISPGVPHSDSRPVPTVASTRHPLPRGQASDAPFFRVGQDQGAPNPGILTGAYDFVIDHPIMVQSQQFQLHYHGSSQRPRERQTSPEDDPSVISPQPATRRGGNMGSVINPTPVAENARSYEESEGRTERRRKKALKALRDRAIPGAEYNSAERDPPLRCHPGTRTAIREEFQARIEDSGLQTRIVWMHGPAGVGKSAIMQTLVEEVSRDFVCATLFFSRPNQRDDARKAFPTLAYALAVTNPEYHQYIGKRLEDDPTCLAKSLDDQFRMLFITPFVENQVDAGSQPWVMFLDGLDECQNVKESDNQCRIMKLVCDSILRHAESTPFIWVIASRPEENLKKAWIQIQDLFQEQEWGSDLWELEIPVDSDQATQDVELYLHHQFEAIKRSYSDLMPTQTQWPSDGDFVKIAKKSSGLFVFASTVTSYISDEDPIYRLEFVVSLIDRADQDVSSANEKPFHMIDLLYSSIMSDVPQRLLPIVKSLLGLYQLHDIAVHRKPFGSLETSLVEACNILGIQQNEVYASLRKLRSVLIYPSPETAQVSGIRFFHASFPDFLVDRSRSTDYHVDLNQELTNIWRCYTNIIEQSVTDQGCARLKVSWSPRNSPFVVGEIQRQMYWTAQHSWVKVVINNSGSRSARGLQIDSPVLIRAFESLGLAFLDASEFPVEDFLRWLRKDAPAEVRDRVSSGVFSFWELDTARLHQSLGTGPSSRTMQYNNIP